MISSQYRRNGGVRLAIVEARTLGAARPKEDREPPGSPVRAQRAREARDPKNKYTRNGADRSG